jgi:hypothetical protein
MKMPNNHFFDDRQGDKNDNEQKRVFQYVGEQDA